MFIDLEFIFQVKLPRVFILHVLIYGGTFVVQTLSCIFRKVCEGTSDYYTQHLQRLDGRVIVVTGFFSLKAPIYLTKSFGST